MFKRNVVGLAKKAAVVTGLIMVQTNYVHAGVFEVIHPDVKKGEYD